MKYVVAVLMVIAGAALAIVSITDHAVPKGLQGWGLACGVFVAIAGGIVTEGIAGVTKAAKSSAGR